MPRREYMTEDRQEPTWGNQLWHARRLLAEKGFFALLNPHARTGEMCGCGDCFCCAALYVARQYRSYDAPRKALR